MGAISYFLYTTGPLYNDLARCWAATPPVPTPAEDALYPIVNLWDQDPSNPFMFTSADTDSEIAIDKNMMANGDMSANDGAGHLTWWNEADTGTGAVSYQATAGPTGGPAAKFLSGTGTASIFNADASGGIPCRPGELLILMGSMKGQDGTHPIRLRVQNMLDLTWLKADGTWQTAQTDVFVEATGSWVDFFLAFRVPSYAALGWPLAGHVVLRPTIIADAASTTAYATNVFLWGGSSLLSVHGYDQQPQLGFEFYRGGVGLTPSYTLQAALTPVRPAFYYALPTGSAPLQDRFFKVKLPGTPSTPPWMGEAVLSQYDVLTTGYQFGGKVSRLLDQVRYQAAFGPQRARAVGQLERRLWSAKFSDLSQAAFDEFLEQVMRRSGYGTASPIVMIPENDAPIVIHGPLPAQTDPTRIAWNRHDRELSIPEDPFPSFSA